MSDKRKGRKGDKSKGEKKAKRAEAAGASTAAGIVEELREAGARLVAAANSPAGREAIAVGLSIAATAAQAAITARRTKTRAKPEGVKAEPAAAEHSAGQEALAAVLGGVAETVLTKIFPKKA